MNINKKLLAIKAHYFIWNAGTAPVVAFMSLYARQLGFSSVIVGIIYMILPIAGMIAKPTMGAIADRYRCQKIIFLIAQIITAIAFLSIFYVPSLPLNDKVHLSCDNGVAVFDTSPNPVATLPETILNSRNNINVECDLNCAMESKHWNTICNSWHVEKYCTQHGKSLDFKTYVPLSKIDKIGNTVYFEIENSLIDGDYHKTLCSGPETKIATICDIKNCNETEVNNLFRTSDVGDDDVIYYYQFWVFLALMITSWVAQAIVVSVGDAICFELLEDKPSNYGHQRAFGALGWGTFSLIAGFMVDGFSENGEKNYVSVFYLSFVTLIIDFIVSSRIKYTQKNLSTTILKDVGQLLTNLRILIFIVWCIAIGMCTGLMWQFFLWLIDDKAKAYSPDSEAWVTTLQGLAMSIQCLAGELPFFFLSGWILKRIGHVLAMTLILAVIGVRYILYSIIANPWLFLPIEVLNGVTFGLAYASMASYACVIAPPGTATTVQGLMGAVFEGIGVSVGSFLGGILYKNYGGAMTFRIFGIGSLIACLIHALVQYLLTRKHLDKDILEYATPQDALSMVHEDYQELHVVQ